VTLDERVQQEAGIRVERVEQRRLPQVIRATGRLTVDETRTWRVGAITDGRIVRLPVNLGETVEQGQVLARMHSHGIHESRAEHRKAVADLDRARATEVYAQRVRDRQKRLYDLRAGSLEQLELAERELKIAQTTVSNAEIEVERTRRHLLEYLRIPLESPYPHVEGGPDEPDEDLIPITSPAAGTLLARNVTPGTVVAPSQELFVVGNLSSLWMLASVSEEYLARLRRGMPVRVFVQAYPDRPFAGKIGRIGETLDPTTRTVTVQVNLANRDGRLKPEMYATAEIELGGSAPALFVPQEATQEVNGQTVVFVRTAPNRFEARPVQTGRPLAGELEILQGLSAGEMVATRGSFILKSQLLRSTLAEEE
jgi:cobalt-zinc-cadmium efflux system membrane fusion protein